MAIINFFEVNSLFGRVFLNKKPPLKKGINYLNLGSGKIRIEGWLTSDFYPTVFPNFLRFSKYRSTADWMFDFRFPMKCNDNVWDGVYTSHTLEHFNYDEVDLILKEIFRTMKVGTWVRIALPDLRNYINFYNNKDSNLEFKKMFKTGAEAISSLTQKYGHKSVWDFQILNSFLLKNRFSNIKEVNFGEGTDKHLIIDIEQRRFETFYVEAQKR